MPGIFVTGTDTGCGKTYVTALAGRIFNCRQGADVGVMKPISTGPAKENDAVWLKRKLKLNDPLELINPIRLKHPLAPYPAAKMENRKLNINDILRAYKKLEQRHDLVLVEGIGGVAVPITAKYFVIDLIRELKLPVILVARAGLGTINHTLLTVNALWQEKIELLGIIINGFRGKELSEKSNAAMIRKLSCVPILAELPWIS